jgi:hypothetical protein
LSSLPRRRPSLCPGRAWGRRAALSLSRARPDQPAGARSLGSASRLPGSAAAGAKRARGWDRHACCASAGQCARLRPHCAFGAAPGRRGGVWSKLCVLARVSVSKIDRRHNIVASSEPDSKTTLSRCRTPLDRTCRLTLQIGAAPTLRDTSGKDLLAVPSIGEHYTFRRDARERSMPPRGVTSSLRGGVTA